MRRNIAALTLLLAGSAFAAEEIPIPREGTITTTTIGSATSKALALGKDRVQIAWEWIGATTGDEGKGITHNSSVRCLGTLHAVNGEYQGATNACVITRPDGDQIFYTETTAGKLGGASKGVGTFVGGTGKMAGITGTGEVTRYVVRPALEGTFQSVSKGKMSYKLP